MFFDTLGAPLIFFCEERVSGWENDTEWPVQNHSNGFGQNCQEYFS